ncbi:MAG: TolC family protein [Bacteroidales bacterium]
MNRNFKILLPAAILMAVSLVASSQSPTPDSLSIKEIVTTIVANHPTVKIAREAIINADARIGLARTAYYPEADMTASYSNMGPVIKLTIPDMGTFQLFPENNYAASLNYRQILYDFGKTRQNIEMETGGKQLGEQALEQVKQKLSLYAVNTCYTILFLQAAIKIKDEQLATLNEHLRHVEMMMSTGSATEYQVLSTRVKISGVESQKVDLQAGLTAQQAALNSLLGNGTSRPPAIRQDISANKPLVATDSLLSYALDNRDEMKMNRQRATLASMRYELVRLSNKPIISLQASAGGKNGYVPELGKIRPNYVVGLGLRVPIYDGLRTKYNLAQVKSSINTISEETESTRRAITNELIEAEAYLEAAGKKVSQFELQLAQATKANELAKISFASGIITNLDLLDSNTALSESRLLLLKARIDYAASIYKLEAAMGKRIY